MCQRSRATPKLTFEPPRPSKFCGALLFPFPRSWRVWAAIQPPERGQKLATALSVTSENNSLFLKEAKGRYEKVRWQTTSEVLAFLVLANTPQPSRRVGEYVGWQSGTEKLLTLFPIQLSREGVTVQSGNSLWRIYLYLTRRYVFSTAHNCTIRTGGAGLV